MEADDEKDTFHNTRDYRFSVFPDIPDRFWILNSRDPDPISGCSLRNYGVRPRNSH